MNTNEFIRSIQSQEPDIRNRPVLSLCAEKNVLELWKELTELEQFRHETKNLYERVRATLFLAAVFRFRIMDSSEIKGSGALPADAMEHLMNRRFEEAISILRQIAETQGLNGTLSSALAEAYKKAAFQSLMDQVRKSFRQSRGNQWMFRLSHASEHPIRVRPELYHRKEGVQLYPILRERTPVRLDLSHSGWSDIFFLGMDFPEGARVLNISVELGVHGRDSETSPPVEACLRVIPEPLLRLTSIDLGVTKDVTSLDELFNFGNDYLSLLKAGVIASGLIPPACEGTGQLLESFLAVMVGPGMGIELCTRVNDIPKGSRLAVSTNLLAGIISVCMRATGQTDCLEGNLTELERRLVASRAILGEWLGGSGGGWQDSGGIWPGIKTIEGALAKIEDPEFGISRGCLLPRHRVLSGAGLHPNTTEALSASLILVHGGMAQNVGPILEMVTEKYLLRDAKEWEARKQLRPIFDQMLEALQEGDIRKLGQLTQNNWDGPLKEIIPWVTNQFTEKIIAESRKNLGKDFWGFLMLGGMSGGGMGIFVAPEKKTTFQPVLLKIMQKAKDELQSALPFAMDPVIYNFKINPNGTSAELLTGKNALLHPTYYTLQTPPMARQNPESISYLRRTELDFHVRQGLDAHGTEKLLSSLVGNLFRIQSPALKENKQGWNSDVKQIKEENGFDSVQHDQLRADLKSGRIGLAHNRLPIDTLIEDVRDGDLYQLGSDRESLHKKGESALQAGRVAVFTLAGGVGSRWTQGAGVIKALSPFIQMQGQHRNFLEIHLAKSHQSGIKFNKNVPHLISTSFMTHLPIANHLKQNENYAFPGPLLLSSGKSISQRLIPMVRDLHFQWEEKAQEILDEQKQKKRDAMHSALMDWARQKGEGSDYVDNLPLQLFNPPGHWYEFANLLRNGCLSELLKQQPQVQTLFLHNVDTLGANLDPEALGYHLASGKILNFEVVPRRMQDRGGGLARVNGRLRLLEGLAQPKEEDELNLRYYNTMSTWIEIDPLLAVFGLSREDLISSSSPDNISGQKLIAESVRSLARRLPTYVTLKDVKWRWGHGQEDIYPVVQFEKLWSDMSGLPELDCGYIAVPRMRGQQLKDVSELDPWVKDGSCKWVESLCTFLD